MKPWRGGGNTSWIVSLAIHALILVGAGMYVVKETSRTRRAAFETPPAAPAGREVEHRVQVARKGGGSAGVSPLSAQRLVSSSAQALTLPPLPALAMGGSSLLGGGFSGAGAGVGLGAGAGLATGLSGGGLGGRGMMSLTFLGLTQPRVSKVVLVVDVGRDLMDLRKGGFEAFGVIRAEMLRLVAQLPPSAEFGVVLFGGTANDINLFEDHLVAATATHKEAFFKWMSPVNASVDRLGTRTAGGFRSWTERPLMSAGLDATLLAPPWLKALRAGLELKPDTLFLVTGGVSSALRKRDDERMNLLEQRNEAWKARLRRAGIDPEGVAPARAAALARARKELNEINEQLRKRGKTPFVVTDTKRVFLPDFQAELKRLGFAIELDTTGWADPQGKPIWEMGVSQNEKVDFGEVLNFVARLQHALSRERAAIHAFLFVGPDEKTKESHERLAALAKRNGGRFEVLTAKKLSELRPPASK